MDKKVRQEWTRRWESTGRSDNYYSRLERWASTGPSGNSENYWGGGQRTPDPDQLSSMSACPAHEFIIILLFTYMLEESC